MASKRQPAATAARTKKRAQAKRDVAAAMVARRNTPWAQCVDLADGITLYQGDCVAVMAALDRESVHAVVTDPPYELGFMGKAWDKAGGVASTPATWAAAHDLLKPGGHLVAFAGSRTYHRIACAIEDAGFEIRDQLMWLYGSGFPKSHDVSKCIDKAGGGMARPRGHSQGDRHAARARPALRAQPERGGRLRRR